ncbi:MAG: hypothetical protein MRY32_09880 [Rickettsiales bacterium]|nr:hypothetical protein [Rickettsiales bacterium]
MAGRYVKSDAIGYIQERLSSYYHGSPDKIWGPGFQRALERYKDAAKGYPETHPVIKKLPNLNDPHEKQLAYAELLAAEIKRTIAQQEALNATGDYQVGPADGIRGNATMRGFKAFKSAYEAKRAEHPAMPEFPADLDALDPEKIAALQGHITNPPQADKVAAPKEEKSVSGFGVDPFKLMGAAKIPAQAAVVDVKQEYVPPKMHKEAGYSTADVGSFQMDVFKTQMMLTVLSQYGKKDPDTPNYEKKIGKMDGRFGGAVSGALSLFQDKHPDLETTGKLDVATWDAIHTAYNAIPKDQRVAMETSLKAELLDGGHSELKNPNSPRRLMASALVAEEFGLNVEDAYALSQMPAGRWSKGHFRMIKDTDATITEDGNLKQVSGKGTYYAGRWLNTPVAGSSKHYNEMYHQAWHYTFAANNVDERQVIQNDGRGIMPSSNAKLGQVYRTDNGVLVLCNSSGGFGLYKDRVADLAPAAAKANRADYKREGVVPIKLDYEQVATMAYWRRQQILGLYVPEGVQADIDKYLIDKGKDPRAHEGMVVGDAGDKGLIQLAKAAEISSERMPVKDDNRPPTDVELQSVRAQDQDRQQSTRIMQA